MTRRRSEFQQIADLFAPLATTSESLGLRDDAALIIPPTGCTLITTVDAIVEGVHYLASDGPDLVARKLLRVNLSDVAAMGAEPAGALVACAFAKTCSDHWVETFAGGLAEDLARFSCPLLGGDTVATNGPPVFSLTALGWVPETQEFRRSGARCGDLVAVTGTIGDGALGLSAARHRAGERDGLFDGVPAWVGDALCARYHLPQPRLKAARGLRGLVSSAMDVSDGLVQDLGHICRASGVSARIDRDAVPLSQALRTLCQKTPCPWDRILCGGDDYELLVTLPPGALQDALKGVGEEGLTVLGECVAPGQDGPRVHVTHRGESVFPGVGWQHFQRSEGRDHPLKTPFGGGEPCPL